MVFLIIHNPTDKTPEKRLSQIDGAVKAMGSWSDRLDNTWILETKRQNARTIRDQLKQFIPEGEDKLFVARISSHWSGRNMGRGFPDWLKKRDFGTFAQPKEDGDKKN